ncbi:hypothetical protein SDC9_118959 [bioreactor metagenome]|uniref:N-acetyltransferase domain-containing protein n=1 Tax=bioreactor metagenome TaxID=1076179 RepID=A0A645C456_9ZZZZ
MNCRYERNGIIAEDDNGELMAKADFCAAGDGVIDITHVYANLALRGKGVAGQLMEVMVDYLRKNGLKAVASCSYANSWLQKNSDRCSDVIAAANEEVPIACRIDGQH